MGHEYVGVVEQVCDQVATVNVGDFVVGSFVASDNVCEICRAGYQSRCIHNVMMGSVGTPGGAGPDPLGRRHPGRHAGCSRRRSPSVPMVLRCSARMVRRHGRRGGPGEDGRRGR